MRALREAYYSLHCMKGSLVVGIYRLRHLAKKILELTQIPDLFNHPFQLKLSGDSGLMLSTF